MKGLNKKKIAILVIAEIATIVMSMVAAHRSFLATIGFIVLAGAGTILLSALYEWRLVVGLIISTLVSCILVLKILGWGWALVLLVILLVVLWWKWQFFAKITSTAKFLIAAITVLLLILVLLLPGKTGDNNQKIATATEKKTETSSSEVNSEAKPGEYESTEEKTTIQKVEGLTKDGANADAGSTTGNTNVSTKAKSDSENKGNNGNNGRGGSTQDTQETTEDPNSEPSTNQKASEKASEIGQGTTNPEKPVTGKPEGKTVVPTTEAPAEVQTTKKKFEPEEETTSVKKLEPITPTQTPTTKVVTQPTTKTVTQPTTKVVTQPTTKVMTQPTTQQPTTQQPTTQQPTTQAHAATITVAYTEGSAVARVAVSANFTPLVTTTWKKAGASCSAKVISNDGNNVIIEVDVPANFKDTLWVRVFDDGVERAQYVKKINNLGH